MTFPLSALTTALAASVLRPRLSSVRQPIEDVAHKLVEVLLAELSGAQRQPSPEKLLTPWLVARESGPRAPGAQRRSFATSFRRSGTEGGGAKRDLPLRG